MMHPQQMEYLFKHSEELSKYAGRCIAVVDRELVAEVKNRLEAYKEAKKKHPRDKIAIFYIPTEDETGESRGRY
jgi:hypothetical protein